MYGAEALSGDEVSAARSGRMAGANGIQKSRLFIMSLITRTAVGCANAIGKGMGELDRSGAKSARASATGATSPLARRSATVAERALSDRACASPA